MKKLYASLSALMFAFFVLCTNNLFAQDNLYKIGLAEKVDKSSLIVEGRIVGHKSFWNERGTMIYTSNKVEVYKVFKGNVSTETIEVLTQGGTVGPDHVEASDLLSLEGKELGVFFVSPNSLSIRNPATGNVLWDVYSSSQGFYNYNLSSKTAVAPFDEYGDIETKFYSAITRLTNRPIQNKKPGLSIYPASQNNVAATIDNFSPSTVWAGATLSPANNLLTINGSGFGAQAAPAAVLFPNANDGGASQIAVLATDPLVVSWTPTQIQIRVPTLAGSGTLQVRDGSSVITNAGPISVVFSALTATFVDPGNSTAYTKESNLYNQNTAGGYNLYYSTSTANGGVNIDVSPAKATFQRALNTWKEICGFNVVEFGTTTSQAIAVNDNMNVVMFDNTATGNLPLAAGVLAVCYSRNSICTNDYAANAAVKTQFDIVIRNTGVSTGSTTFTIGPCPPNASNLSEIDLETVLLHELGHALNLGHINDPYQGSSVGYINPNKLMHYAVVNSVRRITPDYSAKFGADYLINPQGNNYGTCGITEMIKLAVSSESKDDCPLTFPSTALSSNTSVTFDLVHATSNRFVDPSYLQVRCDGLGASITNNAYYALRTGNAVGDLSLIVSGYGTTPAANASCPTVYVNVPTTGVRLSLYQVSTCPAAGSFPAPIACRSFTGNGPVTSFTNLAANTNYLLFAEGIENTKSSFNILFNGSALPVKVAAFAGEMQADHNLLKWSLDNAGDIRTIVLERSTDGVNFVTANTSEYTNARNIYNDVFRDYRAFAGTNYYRLVMISASGAKEFSNVVVLKRKENFIAGIYPNPVKGEAKINISTVDKGLYSFRVYNVTGQLVSQMQQVISGQQTVPVNVAKFSKGTYLLKIYGPDNQLKQNISFLVD